MRLPIALQLFTIRDILGQDVDAGLKQVADIGYSHVELAGTCGLEPAAFKDKLDAVGLTAISAHTGPEAIAADKLSDTLSMARTFGFDKMAVAFLGDDWRNVEGYKEAARLLSDASKQAADQGVHIGYHNHAFEFEIQADGRSGYQILVEETDPAVFLEMDVYWFVKGDQDPLQWMAKLEGRVPLLHMKDMNSSPDRGFAEVGTGTIDLKQIASVAPSHGVQALIVEQDNNWADNDPMGSARTGYQNLSAMLD